MTLSADQYKRAWEQSGDARARYNSRIISGTCVLETLSMAHEPDMRYVFVDDFGYAVAYCRQRLREDLAPPDQHGADKLLEHWREVRSAFAPETLANAWAAADVACSALLDAFVAGGGYTPALGKRLREIVNIYGFDLELGEVYTLPQDMRTLLERIGEPFVWWDDDVEHSAQKHPAFDFANRRHRATLARRLREANGASGLAEVGAVYTPYQLYRAGEPGEPDASGEDHALN